MLHIRFSAFVITGCIFIYVIFLGFASYSSTDVNQSKFGFYAEITGNYPVPKNFTSNNTFYEVSKVSNDTFWERCELPKIDVWDDELLPYLNPDRNPLQNCDQKFSPLTELKNSSWSITNSKTELVCRARCHSRKTESSNIIGNWTYSPGPVNCEILETVCANNTNDVYGYLHTQIIEKPKETPKVDVSSLMQFDVFVILMDSLSYSQAKRFLPRTLSYFTDHLDGVLFPYLNKIGDNSRPNGIPLWFGKSLQEIDRNLFDEGVIPADWTHKYFCNVFKDNETSLFSEFQDYGYRTLLAEDWAKGTMNWPNCVGFDKPPIDHYMRPFQVAYEKGNHGENITRKHLKGHLCRETHHTLLDYLGQFTSAYPDQKKFGWIWAIDLGHNTENGFPHADKDFQHYLIKHRKQLDNSFVFLLGDHGLRFGGIRNTLVGALDVNNPLTAVSIPKVLRKTTNILEIMKENAQKLQTHYDTRATILDIMKYQSSKNFMETEPSPIAGEKGFSYIRKQPETPRSCRNIPVPLEYCICQYNKTKIPTDTEIANNIGIEMTKKVNEQIIEGNFTDVCIEMQFEKTLSLLEFNHKFKEATLFKVTVEMKEPSKAQFKGSVKINNGKIQVLGMVERSNKYGKTADCIKSETHRPYCYCKNQPDTQEKPKKNSKSTG